MKKLRFGILGCGGMARQHAIKINENPDAELVALCDVNEKITGAFADFLAGKNLPKPATFTDPAEMYREAKLDAVAIVTPHTLHFQHGMQALDAGCHVMMEKPMVTSSADAYLLADKVRETGKFFVVGFITSFTPVFQYLRGAIREGTFGRLQMVSGYLSQGWLKGTVGLWRQNPELSGGGQAYDSGAHILNSMMWSVESPVAEVFALIDNCGSPVDINSVISVRFQNNVMAGICVSGDCPSSGSHMVFVFDGGRVEIDGWGGAWIKPFKKGEAFEPELPAGMSGPVNNLVDCILGRAEPATTPLNGILHSELMDAIYESASTGQPVRRKKHSEKC